MKLLLTSNGLSNDSIAKAFQDLIGKEPKDAKVAFIPTAANPERGDKKWLIDDMYRIKEKGYYLDVIELPATRPEELKKILEEMDAIFVGGGNTFYLSYWMQKSRLFEMLPELLRTRVYAGISAGSMITGKSLTMASQALKNPTAFEDKDYDLLGPEGQSAGESLKFVDFLIRPHLNGNHFPHASKEFIEKAAKNITSSIYAIDDNSAVKVVDGNIEVISEGEWLLFNEPAGNS